MMFFKVMFCLMSKCCQPPTSTNMQYQMTDSLCVRNSFKTFSHQVVCQLNVLKVIIVFWKHFEYNWNGRTMSWSPTFNRVSQLSIFSATRSCTSFCGCYYPFLPPNTTERLNLRNLRSNQRNEVQKYYETTKVESNHIKTLWSHADSRNYQRIPRRETAQWLP